MPPSNRFRHQVYTAEEPKAPWRIVRPDDSYPTVGSEEFFQRMRVVGRAFRASGVSAVYLMHGTFAGLDAFGVLAELGRFSPAAADALGRVGKAMADKLLDDAGNYTIDYARRLEDALNQDGEDSRIEVRLFHWSGRNNHIGRADAAVRLIDHLVELESPTSRRILIWGHSHAGNVLALTTNLLGGDRAARDDFFRAAAVYFRWPLVRCVDVPVWRRVEESLRREGNPLVDRPLDIVTLGAPIRYGWETTGYAKLLHFVHHRPHDGRPSHRAAFPPSADRLLAAADGDADGDYVQQFGIAGTNFAPSFFALRSWLADRRLNDLLQPGIRRRDLVDRLRAGLRVADEGTTLLVDYGPSEESAARHIFGHAVYTRESRMLFHAESVARELYGQIGQDAPLPPA